MQHLPPIIVPGQGACTRFESRLYKAWDAHATNDMRQSEGEQTDQGCDQPSAPPKGFAPQRAQWSIDPGFRNS